MRGNEKRQGDFIESLRNELDEKGIEIKMVGIRASEQAKAVRTIQNLIVGD